MTCHNGEINTIRTTRNAVSAFARGLRPPLPGGDLLTSKQSDSASLDEWVEYLMLEQNWSLLRALRLSIPPVWDTEADVWGPGGLRSLHLLSPHARQPRRLGWPCRNHRHRWPHARRPSSTAWACARCAGVPTSAAGSISARESGVFGLDTTTIVASGQLQPGQMIALDTATGERLDSYQIMARVVDGGGGPSSATFTN